MRHFFPILALLAITGCASGPSSTVAGGASDPFRTDLKHEKYLATAQQPIATGYPVSTQYTMQSMHHWDLLAGKVAAQGSQALNHFFAGTDIGVYVAPAGTTPFSKTYREALITQLLAYGVPINFSPEGSVTLEVQIEMRGPIRRVADDSARSRRKKYPGIRHTAEPEFLQEKNAKGRYQQVPVVSEEEGYFGSNHSKAEIQVNTSLVHPRGYIYRDSSIFYVESSQLRNYLHRPGIGDTFLKRYVIVDK